MKKQSPGGEKWLEMSQPSRLLSWGPTSNSWSRKPLCTKWESYELITDEADTPTWARVGVFAWGPWSTLSWSSIHRCVWSHFSGVRGTVLEAGGILVGLPRWLSGKESACNVGDTGVTGSILGLGRSTGGEHGNPLQYSCLENLMDRGAWWALVLRVTEIRTQRKWLSPHAQWSKYTGLCSLV